MKPHIWQPTAKNCSKCSNLKAMLLSKNLDPKKKENYDQEKKLCEKFSWEIPNEMANRSAVCKIEVTRMRSR